MFIRRFCSFSKKVKLNQLKKGDVFIIGQNKKVVKDIEDKWIVSQDLNKKNKTRKIDTHSAEHVIVVENYFKT